MLFSFLAIFHVLQCTFLNFPPYSVFLAIFHVLKGSAPWLARLPGGTRDAAGREIRMYVKSPLSFPCAKLHIFFDVYKRNVRAVEKFPETKKTKKGNLHCRFPFSDLRSG